VKEIERMCK